MPNEVSLSVAREVLTRSDGRCELCGARNNNHLHHIVFRRHRNHQPEALIMVCGKHNPHENTDVNFSLKFMLCRYYEYQGFNTDEIRGMMGGRYYDTSKELDPIYMAHLRRLKCLYGGK